MANYLQPEILARITQLGLRAERVVEGTISGLHRSPLHGVSVEFADHREYAPGDDLKRLDWRVYARSDRFYVKRFEEESNLRAHLVLDVSASMQYQGQAAPWSKYDCGATIAASLAALAVKQRDAVGLITFDTQPREILRPAATAAQLAKIIENLEATEPHHETELGAVLSEVADRIKSRGIVVLISDMLGELESLYQALGKLQHAGHEILIFHVLDRDEIELPFRDSVIFRDIEGTEEIYAEPWAFRRAYRAAMDQFIDQLQRRCRYCGIDHLLVHTDSDLAGVLSHYLHQRLRRGSVKHRGHMASLGSSS